MQLPGYKIIRKINQGGMSTVYLAVEKSLNRLVALKVMSPALNADPVFSERFQREAKIVGGLSHPNIIAIYDVGTSKTINYIAMDYLEQGSIGNKIKQGMTAKESLKIIHEIALALHHAHTEGYIHRDIKAENILLRDDNTAVLSDFGVARSVSNNTQMTNAGTVLGTPNYMSPEQARGKDLDGRSDIYSLGIVLYEMLVGEPPYKGDEAVAIAIQHLTAPPPKLPKKYASLQPLLSKMVAKRAQDRFQTAMALANTVEKILNSLSGANKNNKQTQGADGSREATSASKAKHSLQLRALSWLNQFAFWSKRKTQLTNELDKFYDDRGLSNGFTSEFESGKLGARHRTLFMVIPLLGIAFVALAIWYWQSYQNLPEILQGSKVGAIVSESQVDSGDTHEDPPTEVFDTIDKLEPVDPQRQEDAATEDDTLAKYSLLVNTLPSNAQVRVMNIKEKYRPKIELPKGRYLLEIQAKGFYLYEQWIDINDGPKTVSVKLDQAHAPGDSIQHRLSESIIGPKLTVLPPGSFIMGSLRYQDSQPRHEVVFDRPFAIGESEVTFEDFDYFLSDTKQPKNHDQNWGRGQRPAINVTWHQAQAYTSWLADKTKRPYRLATESEWEYAASHFGTQEYPWIGDATAGRNQANCKRGCSSQFVTLFTGKTAPVKTYSASPLGIYDFAGNAAEWTSSCYTSSYNQKNQNNCQRVVRGGSYLDNIEELNVFRRVNYAPEFSDKFIGFRLFLELPKISTID